MGSFHIHKIQDPRQLETFIGAQANSPRISLYLWQNDWSKEAQRKWTRRLRSALESAFMSYYAKAGAAFPHVRQVLNLPWKEELTREGSGTFIAFVTPEALHWFHTPQWLGSQAVVAKSFHIKPLFMGQQPEWAEHFPSPSERKELVDAFLQLKTRGVATDHLPTAARWIAQGKATVLMASARRNVWGEIETKTGRVQIDSAAKARGCDDVLDDLVETASKKGVSCCVVDDDELPSASPIAVFNVRRGA
jgi:hypothetical protein